MTNTSTRNPEDEKNMPDDCYSSSYSVFKLKFSKIIQKPTIILPTIALIGLVLRISVFPYEVPFKLDVLDIFSYAVLTSQLGYFPKDFALANNGWPGFVSMFFSLSNTNNFFDFVHLQRILSIMLSVATIIPIYLLSRRFFEKPFAFVAVALFALDFRIVIDSLTGGNLPLFIFLVSLGIFLFLSKNNRVIYLSFGVIALASLIRYEGLILLIPFSIMFFIRLRKQRKIVFKYFIAISIAILVLLPMAYIRIENMGRDGLTSHLLAGILYYNYELLTGYDERNVLNDEPWTKPGQNNVVPFIISGLAGIAHYLIWITVPTFMFFVPVSIFFIFKNQSYKKIESRTFTIILIGLFMLLPAFYAYGRHFHDAKYLYVLFPIICLVCVYPLNVKKIKKSLLFSLVLISIILFLSSSSIYYKNLDLEYEHERETFKITNYIVANVNGINYFYPESQLIKSSESFQKWPNIPATNPVGHKGNILRDTILISTDGYQSLEKFILDSKDKGLSHILVDGRTGRNYIENSVFYNEEKYPYLIKEFDSKDHDLKYHVKIFKIDYNIFENSEI